MSDVKGRAYADFAKMEANIYKMKDGKRKAKALILLQTLKELLNCDWTEEEVQQT